MLWISKNSTYYDKGKRAFGCGDEIPDEVLESMGKETLEEYIEKGLVGDSVVEAEEQELEIIEESKEELAERERNAMFERAKVYGLKPHPKTGIVKLEKMVKDFEDLQALKRDALELGIDPSDDVTFEELTILVNEKIEADESDS